jgi:DNA-binding MarR family transcriptional regulator
LAIPTVLDIVGFVNGFLRASGEVDGVSEQPAAMLRSTPSWLLSRTAAIGQRFVADALATVGARRYHVSVLATLDEFGPLSQAELGRRCGIDRSDMVALINELSDRGHVAREPDTVDRRRNVITITEVGRSHLQELRALVAGAQDDILAGLSTEERVTLVGLLTRIVESHPEFVAGGWGQPGSTRSRD